MRVEATGGAGAGTAAGRHQTLRVAGLWLAWLVATAWMRPLMLPDEGRYVGVAWEMLRSGDWLTPTLNGMPFFHKPPLMYWLTAPALALFGLHEAAGRVAPLAGAFVGGMALFLFLRRWAGAAQAQRALCVLGAMPLFYVGAQFANLDMLVAGCISACVLAFAHTALCLEAGLPHQKPLAGAYALAAFGVLAKGLIGGLLPALVIVLWLVLWRRGLLLLRLLWLPGLLLFVAVAAPWFVAMQWQHPAFLDYFFVVQHFKRFAAGGFNNVLPFWFYPALLLLASLPFLPWLWRGARAGAAQGDNSVRWLMLVWAAVITVFFSLPASKLVGYVLPAVPPLAALVAAGLPPRWGWPAKVALGLSALVGLGVVVGLAIKPPPNTRELAAALAQHRGAKEPVLSLAPYPYDLPFYAHLVEPIAVVDDWDSPAVSARDDWRKELADAGHFAPAVAAQVLVTPRALPARLCAAPVSWVITDSHDATAAAKLIGAEPVFTGPARTLWRVRADAPGSGCGKGR